MSPVVMSAWPVVALFVAVPLGVMLGWYRTLLAIFDPLITALYSMPRVARNRRSHSRSLRLP